MESNKLRVIQDYEKLTDELKEQILSMYKDFSNNCLRVQSKNIEQYHRREITRKLVHLIKEITG